MVLCILGECFCYDIQVGTVLFTKADLMRKCWTESDKALLRARLIMQDVLPDPRCLDFSKPSTVSVTLDYIFACFQIISTSTYGKLQQLMFLALADTVGGYLRAYVLPSAKKSYYAGLVTYEEACRVFRLYDEVREYLKTNGVGWAEPQKVVFKNFKVAPLEIMGGNAAACNILYTIEKKGKLHCINAKCSPKISYLPDLGITDVPGKTTTEEQFKIFTDIFKLTTTPLVFLPEITEPTPSTLITSTTERKMNSTFRKTYKKLDLLEEESSGQKPCKRFGELHIDNETMEEFSKEGGEKRNVRCDRCQMMNSKKKVKAPRRIIIPLPILDDECEPHTIAVPFRKRPLRNLRKRNSAFILEHYYVAVLQCLIGKESTRADIKNFNAQFHNWLTTQVYPRLEDETWYPAFGGVLRVRETIKRFGAEAKLNEPMAHDIAFMFRKGFGFEYIEDEEESASKGKPRGVGKEEYCELSQKRRYYALAILTAASVWFFVFCICAIFCLGFKRKNSDLSVKVTSQTSFCPPPGKPQPSVSQKKSVSFQFLVRQNEDPGNVQHLDKSNKNLERNKLLNEENLKEITEKEESRKSAFIKQNMGNNCRNDVVLNVIPKKKNPWALSDTFKGSMVPNQKHRTATNPKSVISASLVCPPEPPDCSEVESKVLHTIWRNPFMSSTDTIIGKGFRKAGPNWFRLSSKKESVTSTLGSVTGSTAQTKTSTEMRTSPYSFSTADSLTSTSNCTSHTPLDEKCSSATTEYFGKPAAKQKPTKNNKKKLSSKSQTDDDSCTSENDY